MKLRYALPLVCALHVMSWSCATFPAYAQQLGPNERIERVAPPVRVQLDSIPMGSLVTMLMRDIMRVPYVIAPEVLRDRRPVSVDLTMPRAEIPLRTVTFLREMGFTVERRGGTVYVGTGTRRTQAASSAVVSPQGSPLSPSRFQASPPSIAPTSAPIAAPIATPLGQTRNIVAGSSQQSESSDSAQDVVASRAAGDTSGSAWADAPEPADLVIWPAHRSVAEIADTLEAVIPALLIAARPVNAPDGTTIQGNLEPDSLVVSGSPELLDRVERLVAAIDRPAPVVDIRAAIMEVRETQARSNALAVVADVLGGAIQGNLAGGAPLGQDVLRLGLGGLQLILSATRGDGRFNILAEPAIAARSGAVATVNAGSQVPTIGALSFAEDGTPIRSVIYRDSGVSLTVQPVVRGGEIDLAVTQERSSFVRTTTGVDDSPTLNRSTSSSRFSLAPGETIVMAGVQERTEETRRDGLFGGLLGGRSNAVTDSQLVVVIEANLVDGGEATPTRFLRLGGVGGSAPDEDNAAQDNAAQVAERFTQAG